MSDNYISRISRSQNQNLRPILDAILNHLGAIATLVGIGFVFVGSIELFNRQFDRSDALFAVVLLPFALMLIYLITSSRRHVRD